MSIAPRQPFSVRLGLKASADAAPYDGVPVHLLTPLQEWVRSQFDRFNSLSDEAATSVCLRLRIEVPVRWQPANVLALTSGTDLLDVVDEILAYRKANRIFSNSSNELARMLDDAGSAYRVKDSHDGLEERILQPVREAVSATLHDAGAATAVGSAASHLETSWQAAYGLHPDPVRAYSEAIKAVEAAAHAVIQPNHAKATLGTMLGEIKTARHKFRTAVSTPAGGDPIAPVEAMMRALWDGQTSRHGNQLQTVPETLEAARAGVHLAAALVQWFASGAVTREP